MGNIVACSQPQLDPRDEFETLGQDYHTLCTHLSFFSSHTGVNTQEVVNKTSAFFSKHPVRRYNKYHSTFPENITHLTNILVPYHNASCLKSILTKYDILTSMLSDDVTLLTFHHIFQMDNINSFLIELVLKLIATKANGKTYKFVRGGYVTPPANAAQTFKENMNYLVSAQPQLSTIAEATGLNPTKPSIINNPNATTKSKGNCTVAVSAALTALETTQQYKDYLLWLAADINNNPRSRDFYMTIINLAILSINPYNITPQRIYLVLAIYQYLGKINNIACLLDATESRHLDWKPADVPSLFPHLFRHFHLKDHDTTLFREVIRLFFIPPMWIEPITCNEADKQLGQLGFTDKTTNNTTNSNINTNNDTSNDDYTNDDDNNNNNNDDTSGTDDDNNDNAHLDNPLTVHTIPNTTTQTTTHDPFGANPLNHTTNQQPYVKIPSSFKELTGLKPYLKSLLVFHYPLVEPENTSYITISGEKNDISFTSNIHRSPLHYFLTQPLTHQVNSVLAPQRQVQQVQQIQQLDLSTQQGKAIATAVEKSRLGRPEYSRNTPSHNKKPQPSQQQKERDSSRSRLRSKSKKRDSLHDILIDTNNNLNATEMTSIGGNGASTPINSSTNDRSSQQQNQVTLVRSLSNSPIQNNVNITPNVHNDNDNSTHDGVVNGDEGLQVLNVPKNSTNDDERTPIDSQYSQLYNPQSQVHSNGNANSVNTTPSISTKLTNNTTTISKQTQQQQQQQGLLTKPLLQRNMSRKDLEIELNDQLIIYDPTKGVPSSILTYDLLLYLIELTALEYIYTNQTHSQLPYHAHRLQCIKQLRTTLLLKMTPLTTSVSNHPQSSAIVLNNTAAQQTQQHTTTANSSANPVNNAAGSSNAANSGQSGGERPNPTTVATAPPPPLAASIHPTNPNNTPAVQIIHQCTRHYITVVEAMCNPVNNALVNIDALRILLWFVQDPDCPILHNCTATAFYNNNKDVNIRATGETITKVFKMIPFSFLFLLRFGYTLYASPSPLDPQVFNYIKDYTLNLTRSAQLSPIHRPAMKDTVQLGLQLAFQQNLLNSDGSAGIHHPYLAFDEEAKIHNTESNLGNFIVSPHGRKNSSAGIGIHGDKRNLLVASSAHEERVYTNTYRPLCLTDVDRKLLGLPITGGEVGNKNNSSMSNSIGGKKNKSKKNQLTNNNNNPHQKLPQPFLTNADMWYITRQYRYYDHSFLFRVFNPALLCNTPFSNATLHFLTTLLTTGLCQYYISYDHVRSNAQWPFHPFLREYHSYMRFEFQTMFPLESYTVQYDITAHELTCLNTTLSMTSLRGQQPTNHLLDLVTKSNNIFPFLPTINPFRATTSLSPQIISQFQSFSYPTIISSLSNNNSHHEYNNGGVGYNNNNNGYYNGDNTAPSTATAAWGLFDSTFHAQNPSIIHHHGPNQQYQSSSTSSLNLINPFNNNTTNSNTNHSNSTNTNPSTTNNINLHNSISSNNGIGMGISSFSPLANANGTMQPIINSNSTSLFRLPTTPTTDSTTIEMNTTYIPYLRATQAHLASILTRYCSKHQQHTSRLFPLASLLFLPSGGGPNTTLHHSPFNGSVTNIKFYNLLQIIPSDTMPFVYKHPDCLKNQQRTTSAQLPQTSPGDSNTPFSPHNPYIFPIKPYNVFEGLGLTPMGGGTNANTSNNASTKIPYNTNSNFLSHITPVSSLQPIIGSVNGINSSSTPQSGFTLTSPNNNNNTNSNNNTNQHQQLNPFLTAKTFITPLNQMTITLPTFTPAQTHFMFLRQHLYNTTYSLTLQDPGSLQSYTNIIDTYSHLHSLPKQLHLHSVIFSTLLSTGLVWTLFHQTNQSVSYNKQLYDVTNPALKPPLGINTNPHALVWLFLMNYYTLYYNNLHQQLIQGLNLCWNGGESVELPMTLVQSDGYEVSNSTVSGNLLPVHCPPTVSLTSPQNNNNNNNPIVTLSSNLDNTSAHDNVTTTSSLSHNNQFHHYRRPSQPHSLQQQNNNSSTPPPIVCLNHGFTNPVITLPAHYNLSTTRELPPVFTQPQALARMVEGYLTLLPPLHPNTFAPTLVSALYKISEHAILRVQHRVQEYKQLRQQYQTDLANSIIAYQSTHTTINTTQFNRTNFSTRNNLVIGQGNNDEWTHFTELIKPLSTVRLTIFEYYCMILCFGALCYTDEFCFDEKTTKYIYSPPNQPLYYDMTESSEKTNANQLTIKPSNVPSLNGIAIKSLENSVWSQSILTQQLFEQQQKLETEMKTKLGSKPGSELKNAEFYQEIRILRDLCPIISNSNEIVVNYHVLHAICTTNEDQRAGMCKQWQNYNLTQFLYKIYEKSLQTQAKLNTFIPHHLDVVDEFVPNDTDFDLRKLQNNTSLTATTALLPTSLGVSIQPMSPQNGTNPLNNQHQHPMSSSRPHSAANNEGASSSSSTPLNPLTNQPSSQDQPQPVTSGVNTSVQVQVQYVVYPYPSLAMCLEGIDDTIITPEISSLYTMKHHDVHTTRHVHKTPFSPRNGSNGGMSTSAFHSRQNSTSTSATTIGLNHNNTTTNNSIINNNISTSNSSDGIVTTSLWYGNNDSSNNTSNRHLDLHTNNPPSNHNPVCGKLPTIVSSGDLANTGTMTSSLSGADSVMSNSPQQSHRSLVSQHSQPNQPALSIHSQQSHNSHHNTATLTIQPQRNTNNDPHALNDHFSQGDACGNDIVSRLQQLESLGNINKHNDHLLFNPSNTSNNRLGTKASSGGFDQPLIDRVGYCKDSNGTYDRNINSLLITSKNHTNQSHSHTSSSSSCTLNSTASSSIHNGTNITGCSYKNGQDDDDDEKDITTRKYSHSSHRGSSSYVHDDCQKKSLQDGSINGDGDDGHLTIGNVNVEFLDNTEDDADETISANANKQDCEKIEEDEEDLDFDEYLDHNFSIGLIMFSLETCVRPTYLDLMPLIKGLTYTPSLSNGAPGLISNVSNAGPVNLRLSIGNVNEADRGQWSFNTNNTNTTTITNNTVNTTNSTPNNMITTTASQGSVTSSPITTTTNKQTNSITTTATTTDQSSAQQNQNPNIIVLCKPSKRIGEKIPCHILSLLNDPAINTFTQHHPQSNPHPIITPQALHQYTNNNHNSHLYHDGLTTPSSAIPALHIQPLIIPLSSSNNDSDHISTINNSSINMASSSSSPPPQPHPTSSSPYSSTSSIVNHAPLCAAMYNDIITGQRSNSATTSSSQMIRNTSALTITLPSSSSRDATTVKLGQGTAPGTPINGPTIDHPISPTNSGATTPTGQPSHKLQSSVKDWFGAFPTSNAQKDQKDKKGTPLHPATTPQTVDNITNITLPGPQVTLPNATADEDRVDVNINNTTVDGNEATQQANPSTPIINTDNNNKPTSISPIIPSTISLTLNTVQQVSLPQQPPQRQQLCPLQPEYSMHKISSKQSPYNIYLLIRAIIRRAPESVLLLLLDTIPQDKLISYRVRFGGVMQGLGLWDLIDIAMTFSYAPRFVQKMETLTIEHSYALNKHK